MRDELFEYYVKLGHTLSYLKAYKISAHRFSNAYTGALAVFSAAGVMTLSFWDAVPLVLAALTLAAQILSALKPYTQAAKQYAALGYILQDMTALFDEVSIYWITVGAREKSLAMSDEIAEKLAQWMTRERQIADRFSGGVNFPFKRRLDKKATEENTRYFWYHFHIKPEEE